MEKNLDLIESFSEFRDDKLIDTYVHIGRGVQDCLEEKIWFS